MINKLKKPVVFIPVIIIIILLLIIVSLNLSSGSPGNNLKPGVIPVNPSSVPAVSRKPVVLPEKIEISGISVNNFNKDPKEIDSFGDVFITGGEEFDIIYFPNTKNFSINILSSPFRDMQLKAEEVFLKKLGITKEQACLLPVDVGTPFYANPDESGKQFPLSFCSK
jgi:hypothetical protein